MLRTTIFAVGLTLASTAATITADAATPVIEAKVPNGLSQDDMAEIVDFIVGNAVFALYHQAGHMMMERFGLDKDGGERQADRFATLTLLDPRSGAGDQTLIDAVDSWKLASEDMASVGAPDLSTIDVHSLDADRANAVICDMVGADRDGFVDVADAAGLSSKTRADCVASYRHARAEWTKASAAIRRPETAKPTPLPVVYDEPDDADSVEATILKDNRVLEEVADRLANGYALPSPPTIRAQNCGEATSRFDPARNELVLCYELSARHGEMILRDISRRN